jgi:glutamate-ammonia-ligase adenylyltransferase
MQQYSPEIYTIILKDVLNHAHFINRWINKNPSAIPNIIKKLNTYRDKYKIFSDIFNKSVLHLDEKSFLKHLRYCKMIEYTLIAYEELTLKKDIIYTSAHLSSLADSILNIAYTYTYRKLISEYGTPIANNKNIRFVVIALGKLGGFELNFSSDIDIIFVYETDEGHCIKNSIKSSIDIAEFYTRLGEKIQFYLSEKTEDGFVFRVDLRLRPDGTRGPLALPLSSYENYYEIYGQTWERLMLLKARPSAGNLSLGFKFLETVKPFIFRKSLDYKVIEDLKDIKAKISRKATLEGLNNKDLKLGKGGIREIEFIVQTLQILNYPKNIHIYNRNTIISLMKIKEHKILNEEDCNILINSYLQLRKWEHLIQISEELQTHIIPESDYYLNSFIISAGYENVSDFYKDYNKITESVNNIFKKILLINTIDKKFFIDEEFTLKDYIDLIKNFNISDPEECAKILFLIIEGDRKRPRKGNEKKLLEKLISYILENLAGVINPQEVLNYFERLFKNPYMIYIVHDIYIENQEIIKKLIYIFSINDYISNLIINTYSIDYIYAPKNPHYEKYDIYLLLQNLINKNYDEEYIYELLRKKHKELIFNAYYAFLTKTIDIISLMHSLSALAEGFLLYAFDKLYNQLIKEFGQPITENNRICDFLIIGMGKLGSLELNIGSDLDLIFLYESQGQTNGPTIISNQEFFSKLTQRVISFLATTTIGGYLYKIDMRLRPSGASGTLVTTLMSFKNYHKKGAMLWEKQALLKGRVINNNVTSSVNFYKIKRDILFSKDLNKNEILEIYNMRFRIEQEKAPSNNLNDIKYGYGGIIDIEFIVQLLQMHFGWKYVSLQNVNTYNVIKYTWELKILNNRDYNVLSNNYIYYKILENLIRGYNNQFSTRLPKNKITLTKIGTFLNYKGDIPSKVITEYYSVRNSTRACFNRIFTSLLN